jgi:hypothetical protein
VSDIQQSWAARGISYQSTDTGASATGFSAPASGLRLTRGGESVDVLVFIYGSQPAAEQDWVLSGAPAPRAGRNAGSYDAIWWNENVVLVLRQRVGQITNEVRDAFLGLGGPMPATVEPSPDRPAQTATPGTPAASVSPSATATGSRTPVAGSPTGTAPAGGPTPPVGSSPTATRPPVITPTSPPPATPAPTQSGGLPTPPPPR